MGMYIAFDVKNGVEYAKLYTAKRDGQRTYKDHCNLGRVLDKERGLYQSRERGVFAYSLESNTYESAPVECKRPEKGRRKEPLIVDFGDVFFLDEFVKRSGLAAAVDAIGYSNPDT
jgi:hypothetical protein